MSTANRPTASLIVELLVVIVVIAILATISIVTYSGIQSRANDVAVRSGVRNLANIVAQMNAVDGSYPRGGGMTKDSSYMGHSI